MVAVWTPAHHDCNSLHAFSPLAGRLPSLAWCSLGGNPAAVDVPDLPAHLPELTLEHLQLADVCLGDGASGEVQLADWEGQQVAVKFFRADVSPDGRTHEELGVSCAVDHPHVTRVRGIVHEPRALVFDLVKGKPLAAKPTSAHLLRCKVCVRLQGQCVLLPASCTGSCCLALS